ncbi:MAG: regulator [Thermoplasmatales archaeon]|nr:regulator [Thermoplasmatales archaeon]MCW6170948.1 regulator [Thermoplasmatales archaeon]
MASIQDLIKKNFSDFPAQRRVVNKILEYGLSIRFGKMYCNDIQIEFGAIGKVCDVDPRIVKDTCERISDDEEMSNIFGKFRSIMNLKDVAPDLGLGEIVLIPKDAKQPGILASVSQVISAEGISIRQAIADDPYITADPKFYIIADSPIPSELLTKLRKLDGIRSITIY